MVMVLMMRLEAQTLSSGGRTRTTPTRNGREDFVDLDTDGTADLMAGGQSYDYGRIRWYKGPEFYPYYNLETNDNVYGLASIDYDSDGDMDIIYRGENSVGMFENTRNPQERFVQRVLMEYPFENGLEFRKRRWSCRPWRLRRQRGGRLRVQLLREQARPTFTGGVLERTTALRAGSTATFCT